MNFQILAWNHYLVSKVQKYIIYHTSFARNQQAKKMFKKTQLLLLVIRLLDDISCIVVAAFVSDIFLQKFTEMYKEKLNFKCMVVHSPLDDSYFCIITDFSVLAKICLMRQEQYTFLFKR